MRANPKNAFEITFDVSVDEVDGGYSASAIGFGISTQGETVKELRLNVGEVIECYFDENMTRPSSVHLQFTEND